MISFFFALMRMEEKSFVGSMSLIIFLACVGRACPHGSDARRGVRGKGEFLDRAITTPRLTFITSGRRLAATFVTIEASVEAV